MNEKKRKEKFSFMERATLDDSLNYQEYLMAMKNIQRRATLLDPAPVEEIISPRRRRHESLKQAMLDASAQPEEAIRTRRISVIASMVPDEIINQNTDTSIRSYESALMFVDVSGFTELCEYFTNSDRGGPSRLTQVLNSYIGAMIQEILIYNGDVLHFSGDAFLAMWKITPSMTMQDVVHTAIDCGLIIQKNYGTLVTDGGIILKVKVAISAGVSYFSLIGRSNVSQSHYVIVGEPVWDVKMAQNISTAGDVLTSANTWMYVNKAEYCTQLSDDKKHSKVLGVGATWKRVEKLDTPFGSGGTVRPAIIAAMQGNLGEELRCFMVTPVLLAVDNDEPMDFLTEVRRVVVIFVNIITVSVTSDVLIDIVDKAYTCVCSEASVAGGLVNKVSMFDKDMMFLVIFGLRGLKHEDETEKALMCAHQLKFKLIDPNILSVSIAVTSGTSYCGVVGHVLRREYTVIGPAVNKGARLIVTYRNKITCDKETFLRSKLDPDFFKLMESKPMKGIVNPGPIYEFTKLSRQRKKSLRHPLLGRNEEMRIFQNVFQNALKQQDRFTRYRDHKFAVAFIGQKGVGKQRVVEECITIAPTSSPVVKLILTPPDREVPFSFIRLINIHTFSNNTSKVTKEIVENKIRYSVNTTSLTPLQIYAINTVFDCGFPLPENFTFNGDLLNEMSVKEVIQNYFLSCFPCMWVITVRHMFYTDDNSWRMLLWLLDTKKLFVIMTLINEENLSKIGSYCLSRDVIVKINMSGINRYYHASLACQLLHVSAIPADLEIIIQTASLGIAGWIQNFVISLVQSGQLSIVTVSRSRAKALGAVIPPSNLLQASDPSDSTEVILAHEEKTQESSNISATEECEKPTVNVTETIQMAVLSESYNFEDITVDMSMDAIILKTYDSLKPFEKMLLKCASVLGDVFSRRMLVHLLQCDSPLKVAQAVERLFSIRVLECEGGDFTQDSSYVMIHASPTSPTATPPYCACLGTIPTLSYRDFPMYAFCGYMKFRNTIFRTTMYELLTESQKKEMHARALLYLERFTRRCPSCGKGSFSKLLGKRCYDDLIVESQEVRRVREQIAAFAAETRMPGEVYGGDYATFARDNEGSLPAFQSKPMMKLQSRMQTDTGIDSKEKICRSQAAKENRDGNRCRSFSSLNSCLCECLVILLSSYYQIIDHCKGAGEYDKLIEAYLEYADLSIINQNIPQAIRLLFELEMFIKGAKSNSNSQALSSKPPWVTKLTMARICSLRAACMLESKYLNEAENQLLSALILVHNPFPISKKGRRFKYVQVSFEQLMIMIAPDYYVGVENGIVGQFYEEIADILNKLYKLFKERQDAANANLAARWSLNYALKTNSNFQLLCTSYGNMIAVYQHKQKFSMCAKLENKAMEFCQRKRGPLDVSEAQAVCHLYTSIFLHNAEVGNKKQCLSFGLTVMNMMTTLTDLSTRQTLVLWMLRILLSEIRIHDVVTVMKEFFYLSDNYDLSSETWYYAFSMIILLDTGYCVETYSTCEKFYIKKGDTILRSKTPDSAWHFYVCMWLVTIRVGAWERSILWEEKIKEVVEIKFQKDEFSVSIGIWLIEGFLITFVREMDNRNIKNILHYEKTITSMFNEIKKACKSMPLFNARYFLLLGYFNFIKGKKVIAYSLLEQAYMHSTKIFHGITRLWIEHTKSHWNGTLSPVLENYWIAHLEADNCLDYKTFDSMKKFKIVPYTLPLPKNLQR